MTNAFPMIPQAEMVQHLERLKQHRVEARYTISDVAFLTGWTTNYIRILERRRMIPKSQRRGEQHLGLITALKKRGLMKKNGKTPVGFGQERFWDEDGARSIMHFCIQQAKKRC